MRILFLIPPPLGGKLPAERIFGCNYSLYPLPNLFLLYPATMLQQAGHRVQVVDMSGRRLRDRDLAQLADSYDVVCLYTVFLSRAADVHARQVLRRANGGLWFVFMGTDPTADPDGVLDNRSVAIRGEPEACVVRVMEAIAGRGDLGAIGGVSYCDEAGSHHQAQPAVIENLESLPFPDRRLLPGRRYVNPKLNRQPFTTIIASRGCSHQCYYCVPNSCSFAREIEYKRQHDGKKPPVRLRSASSVVDECAYLVKSGYRALSFLDDQFIWGKERTLAICEGLRPLGLQWSCLARPDTLEDIEVVEAMGRAGCKYVDMGIESFDQRILDYVRKGLQVESVYVSVRNLRKAGIEPELNILLGSCPLETRATIEATFEATIRLDVDYVLFSVCTPFPYTEFNRLAKDNGWMIEPEYSPIDPMRESFISYPHLTKKELDATVRELYRRFYCRPSYVLRRLRKVRSLRDLWSKASAAMKVLR